MAMRKELQNLGGLYIRRATALLGQGNVKEALAVLEAVPAGDTPPDLGRTTAAALLRLGKMAEAEQAFLPGVVREAIERKPYGGQTALEPPVSRASYSLG